ncbi:hypothetical protein Tco_1491084 [Tanacetum coccineum]
MKTKTAWYEIVGIEDMIPTLWSATKVGVKVEKLHGYGLLEEIVVRRVDQQLYQFKEGDSDIVDFIVALRMFTRSFIIRRRVEDVQLGVELLQPTTPIPTPPITTEAPPVTMILDPLPGIIQRVYVLEKDVQIQKRSTLRLSQR